MSQRKSGLTFAPRQIVGWVNGRPVYPIAGGAPDDDTGGKNDTKDTPKDDSKSGGATKPDDKDQNDDAGKNADSGKPKSDDGDWKAKFEGQRDVNRNLESSLNQLKDGLKSALGIEDKNSKPEELVAGLRKQVADMQHTTTVNDVARRYGITDAADIDFLKSARDEDAMKKLAERLKPTDDTKDDSGKPGRPKPDKSQGSSSDGSGAKATSVAEVMAEGRAAREAKKK